MVMSNGDGHLDSTRISRVVMNRRRGSEGSIVYFGTPSEEYSRLFDEEVWGMPNRKRQFEALLKEESELQVYGKLPMSEYVTRVKKAEFVVCLPGFVWPLCHGLYEAIHLGAIPLLHTNYLRLLSNSYSWSPV